MSNGEDINPPRDHERIVLTDEQIAAIAEKAAKRAREIVYAQVGQGVLRKLAWIAGAVFLGIAFWLAGKGALPK